jgi:phosphoserine aminotransferase
MSRIYNFSAGPSVLPEEVLHQAGDSIMDYKGSGMSVMEMSHRSKVYDEIIVHTEELFRRVLGIPDNYRVLFLQGGATLQFAMVPYNLLKKTADYALTGVFSTTAYEEAVNVGAPHGRTGRKAFDGKSIAYSHIPTQAELDLDPKADYFHYCMNNTIWGSKWHYLPDTGSVPRVTDMSSCILSEPVDISKFALVYAGAQKNIAPAGLTLVIVRDDMITDPFPGTPIMLNYGTQAKSASMYNTPPCWSIYMSMLTLEWIEKTGGLAEREKANKAKADYLYKYLDSQDFYRCKIDKGSRSMMNVTFFTPSDDLDAKFAKESNSDNMTNLKGHRLVGGLRASIYNAMPLAGVEHLVAFMEKFAKANK